MADQGALNEALLEAHAKNDRDALVRRYRRAGEEALSEERVDAAAFYFTHAYVFALEAGHAMVDELRAKLVRMGREA